MTATSRKWRCKRKNKLRVINKIHNSILGVITGMMSVFFILAILSIDNLNKYVILTYSVSLTWLSLVAYSNSLCCVEVGEE
jgi:uncharacterized membrane protein